MIRSPRISPLMDSASPRLMLASPAIHRTYRVVVEGVEAWAVTPLKIILEGSASRPVVSSGLDQITLVIEAIVPTIRNRLDRSPPPRTVIGVWKERRGRATLPRSG